MFLRAISCLLFIGVSGSTFGQFTYTLDQSIPVDANGKTISLPWAGGFNAAQFNTMDLNGDNQPDLVIFEHNANKILTFINQNNAYRYAPEYESLFPPVASDAAPGVPGIDQWVLLRDFNCDGKKDIFTSNPFGISVFVNVTPHGGNLQWRPYDSGNALLTLGFNGNINLQMNGTDISAIEDIDGDGDLDVLDARFVGIGSVEWHKNMSIERTGTCDSLQMVRMTLKWGNFEECNCGQYLYAADSICPVFGGRIAHAAAKSILTIDIDNDGDQDLLFSEETCYQTYFMLNMGTKDSAVMTGFTSYPPVAPIVNFQIFPAPYFEDVDFDGIPDLIVGTNIYARSAITNNFQQSAWFYKNTGTKQLPNFTFIKNNFLQDQMIEVGDNSVPAFIDGDGDGDFDMFIGSYTGPNTGSNLFYYENTGSFSQPAFTLVTSDYNGISELGYYNIKPQFADMDANGTIDFVFTATNIQSGVTSLFYLPNKITGGLDISGAVPIPTNFTIAIDENVTVVDVNQDGLNDILLGKSTGALQYWMNDGPRGSINYSLKNDSFLGLATTTDRQNPVAAVGDLDSDGNADLVLGNQRGVLTIYKDFRAANDSPTGITGIIWDSFSQTYISKNLGGRVWPAVVNLFGGDRPAIALGNLLGGVQMLKNDGSTELPPNPVITIFPNPSPQNKTFIIKSDRDVSAQIISLLGQKISNEFMVPANQNYPVTPQGLASGMYIVRFSIGGKIFSQRLVLY